MRLPGFHQQNSQDKINKTPRPDLPGVVGLAGSALFDPFCLIHNICKMFLKFFLVKQRRRGQPSQGEREENYVNFGRNSNQKP